MAWLAREVFEAPVWLNDARILERVGPTAGGGFAALSGRQASVLTRLLDPRRMATLSEMEAIQPDDAYPLAEFLDDVRAGGLGRAGQASAIDGYGVRCSAPGWSGWSTS